MMGSRLLAASLRCGTKGSRAVRIKKMLSRNINWELSERNDKVKNEIFLLSRNELGVLT